MVGFPVWGCEPYQYYTFQSDVTKTIENSVLRSIGLTQKQLCKMNICEGLCYALFALLTALIIGIPLSIIVCRKISIGTFAGNVLPYQFPFFRNGTVHIGAIRNGIDFLSVWTINRQKKQSIIEQMRAME